jgi:hypothetical protein
MEQRQSARSIVLGQPLHGIADKPQRVVERRLRQTAPPDIGVKDRSIAAGP